MPNQTVKNGLKGKKITLPQMIFFLKKQLKNFHAVISPFHSAKFKKNSYSWSRVRRCTIFGPKMAHLSFTIFFWYKPLLLLSSVYLLALFIVQNLKKFLQRIQSYECNCWAENGSFAQMRIFSENLSMSLVCFIHAYLHPKK